MLPPLLLALLPALGAGHPASVPSGPGRVAQQDPVHLLRVWTQRARRSREGLSDEQRSKVRAVLYETRLLGDEETARKTEIDLAVLDLAGLSWAGSKSRSPEGEESLERVSRLGFEELERRFALEPDHFALWLAEEVLDRPRENSEERRTAAARLLEGRYVRGTRAPLMRTGRTEIGALRDEALEALIGWPDPTVHAFFIELLQPDGRGHAVLVAHLEATRGVLGSFTLDRLRELCGRLYVSDDWRSAARARPLVQALDTERAVPILIEALAVWHRRDATGRGSRRIQHEVLRELQRISGRTIGPYPERWQHWWTAVQEGRVDLPEDLEEGGSFVSSATFFGLRPVSDRVAFVVDRSGSMETLFGTDGRTRYEEAVEQFVGFLEEAGTRTNFAIVLFSDEGRRWRTSLSAATEGNLEQAHRWLVRTAPDGGTRLFEGVAAALRLDRRGGLDVATLDVDTVVVLCDGATAEGQGWVAPWMREWNEEAQVVFHCVQIGSSGDGALEALARLSGGDFVRHDG